MHTDPDLSRFWDGSLDLERQRQRMPFARSFSHIGKWDLKRAYEHLADVVQITLAHWAETQKGGV